MFLAGAEEQRRCADDISQWLMSGTIRPLIDRILPLSDAATAHRLQEDNTIQRTGVLSGKIVLKP